MPTAPAATPIFLDDEERGALLMCLRRPGWANTLDLIGDGADAIKWLRDCELPGDVTPPNTYIVAAIRVAFESAVQAKAFGASAELLDLSAKLGLKRTRS